jgi:O-antigen/teichoic acid export membrane protein
VFLTSLRFTMIIAAPLAVGLIVMADPIILAVFGDQWGGAVVPMQIMAIYGVILALEIPGGTIFKVTGRASILLKLAIPRTIVLYVGIALIASRGINAVAVVLTLITLAFATIALVMASRVIGVRLVSMIGTFWAPLVAAGGTAAALWGVTQVLSAPWPTILVGAAVGGIVYLALLWLVARDALEYLIGKVIPSRA